MQFSDPFATLRDEALKLVSGERRRAIEADEKLDERVKQYRELLEDPRYNILRKEASSDLPGLLRQLVNRGRKIPELAHIVASIDILEKIISDPLDAVLKEDNLLSMESNGF